MIRVLVQTCPVTQLVPRRKTARLGGGFWNSSPTAVPEQLCDPGQLPSTLWAISQLPGGVCLRVAECSKAQSRLPITEGLLCKDPHCFPVLLPPPTRLRAKPTTCCLQDSFSVGLMPFWDELSHLCVPCLSLFSPETGSNNLPAPPCFLLPGH